MARAQAIVEKRVADEIPLTWDFSDRLLSTEVITGTPTLTSVPSGITFGTPTINSDGDQVQSEASGGADKTTYVVRCQVDTDAGAVRSLEGTLRVDDEP